MPPIHGFSADLNSSLVIFSATFPILISLKKKSCPSIGQLFFASFISSRLMAEEPAG